MTLVTVIVKKSRLKPDSMLNFHTHKIFGGVLDTKAVHGRGFYVRRTTGQTVAEMQKTLSKVVSTLKESRHASS